MGIPAIPRNAIIDEMIEACIEDNPDKLREIFDRGNSMYFDEYYYHSNPLIFAVAKHNSFKVLKLLIERGYNINVWGDMQENILSSLYHPSDYSSKMWLALIQNGAKCECNCWQCYLHMKCIIYNILYSLSRDEFEVESKEDIRKYLENELKKYEEKDSDEESL